MLLILNICLLKKLVATPTHSPHPTAPPRGRLRSLPAPRGTPLVRKAGQDVVRFRRPALGVARECGPAGMLKTLRMGIAKVASVNKNVW